MTFCKYIFCFLFLAFSMAVHAQEICDNAIDDDNDGLIDFNDDDCICEQFIPSSLIPNPSFEEMSCCPEANEMLNCADGWIQASAPTTDYVHLCGDYTGNTNIPAFAPEPFADGEGAVGFRDGQSSVGPNYKEYVGACLTQAMEVGVTYRLDFFVGFRDDVPGSLEFDMAIFGSTNCNQLPFGGNSITIGCPANTGQYDQLGQLTVSGNNEWVNIVIDFEPTEPYEVIVLGPACAANPQYTLDPYFYVDRLALAEVGEFGFPLDEEGQICENDLVLSVEDDGESTFQWYKDGIAIIGETGSSINLGANIPDVEGQYMVIIYSDENCTISREYEVRVPPYYAPIDELICESDYYVVGSDTMDQAGYYEITILADDGCDSIVQLTLDVSPTTTSFLDTTFCEGESFNLHNVSVDEPGMYEATISNQAGCDSVITIQLGLIGATAGVDLNPEYELDLGASIDIIPSMIDPNLIDFSWTDDNGILIGDMSSLIDYAPSNTGTIYLYSQDEFGCQVIDTVLVRVNKENIKIYVPNIFSPNNDNVNDEFKFFPTIALDEIAKFVIYDRWGNKVYEAENFSDTENTFWDGQFNGRPALTGVYAYYIDAKFLDGSEQILKGTITLVR